MTDTPTVDQQTGIPNPSQDGAETGVSFGGLVPQGQQPVAGSATPPANPEPQAPAPAADPPVPAVPAQPKVDVVPAQEADGVVVYDPTGDAGLDLALDFMGRLGISGSDPAMVAAANGDFTFLEAKLATMGDQARGWEQHLQLGKDAHARQLEAFNKDQADTNRVIHSIVGGERNWNELVAWAGQNADQSEKDALNAMFDAGGFQAQAAARAILAAYQSAKGTTINPANPAATASGVVAQPQKALTQADYHKEVSALFNKMGNAMDSSPEYADLKRRFFGR